MAYIFDGRQFAKAKEEELRTRVEKLKKKGVTPKLAAILVGNDPASKLYVSLKQKAAERIGIEFVLLQPNEASENNIVSMITAQNEDQSVNGILVQLPLPQELDTKENTARIVNTIDLNKDVDGLTQANIFTSATVKAVLYAIELAKSENFLPKDLSKTDICVVGGTGIVGAGVVKKLEKECEKITIVNSKTENPKALTSQADLLISAVGIPNFIKRDMVKTVAVVIDIGSPKGDVEEGVREIASFFTPVPGGIGPVTVVCLLENTVESVERSL